MKKDDWPYMHLEDCTCLGRLVLHQKAERFKGKVTVDFDEILPWLYIGRVPVNAEDAAYMRQHGFQAVLDLCGDNPMESKWMRSMGVTFRHEFIADGTCPTPGQFKSLVAWLWKQHEEGRKTYVHCHAGAGRAPTIVIAYLMTLGMSLSAATTSVLTKRRWTCVSRAQFTGLARFNQYVRQTCGLDETRDTEA
jgi:atypical dual specificity phosphatase